MFCCWRVSGRRKQLQESLTFALLAGSRPASHFDSRTQPRQTSRPLEHFSPTTQLCLPCFVDILLFYPIFPAAVSVDNNADAQLVLKKSATKATQSAEIASKASAIVWATTLSFDNKQLRLRSGQPAARSPRLFTRTTTLTPLRRLDTSPLPLSLSRRRSSRTLR